MAGYRTLAVGSLLAALSVSCSGGGSSSSTPTGPSSPPPPASASNASITVSEITATTERTSSGVTYDVALTVRETGGRSAATVTSIRVNLSNGSRSGGATWDSSDNITTALAAGGSNAYRLRLTSDNATDLYNQVAFILTFTDDRGVGGTFSSPAGTSVSAPPTASAPAPAPTGGGKFDGAYNFFFKYPVPGGQGSTNSPRFLIIRNSAVSSSDGTVAGAVDGFGAIRFTGPCTINNSVADWTGIMNASALAGANFGQGSYTCRTAIGGGTLNTWQATQTR